MKPSDLLAHYHRERRGTRLLVSAVPDELFDWTPEGSGFSLGGLVRHLIQAESFWRKLLQAAVDGEEYDPFGLTGEVDERMEAFRGVNVGASGDTRLGGNAAECLESWTSVEEKTERFLAGLSAEQIADVSARHPLIGLEAPIGQMVLMMISHEVHHRGQLSAHLKSRDVAHPTTLWR